MLYLKNKAVVPDPFTAKKHIFKPDDHAVQGEQTSTPHPGARVGTTISGNAALWLHVQGLQNGELGHPRRNKIEREE